jgi:PKHD-type hydroxylase C-terminal domain
MLYELGEVIVSLAATHPDHPSVAGFLGHYHKLLQHWSELGAGREVLELQGAMTEPPHVVSGWPEISDSAVGVAPGRPTAPAGAPAVLRML